MRSRGTAQHSQDIIVAVYVHPVSTGFFGGVPCSIRSSEQLGNIATRSIYRHDSQTDADVKTLPFAIETVTRNNAAPFIRNGLSASALVELN